MIIRFLFNLICLKGSDPDTCIYVSSAKNICVKEGCQRFFSLHKFILQQLLCMYTVCLLSRTNYSCLIKQNTICMMFTLFKWLQLFTELWTIVSLKKVNTFQLKFNKNVSKMLYLTHYIDKLIIKQLFI